MSQKTPVCGYKWSTLLVLGILLVAYVMASRDFGMGWDELRRWGGGDAKLQYYQDWWSYLSGELDTAPKAGRDRYPGFFDLTLAVIRALVPIDPMTLGHAYSAIWGWLGLGAVAGIARLLSGWRLALIAVLLLGLAPIYVGHAGHNPKDIPFAAAYAWGLFGLLWLNRRFPYIRYRDWMFCGLLFGGATAVRLAGGIFPVYLLTLLLVRVVCQVVSSNGEKKLPWKAKDAFGFLICICFLIGVLFPFWPAMHTNPFGFTSQALAQLHNPHSVASTKYVHFMGEVYEAGQLPWYGMLWLILIKIPEIWLVGLAGFLIGWVVYLRERFIQKDWDLHFFIGVAILVIAVGFPLGYIVVTGAQVHNGIRHVLFLLPPLSVLAGLGLQAGARFLSQHSSFGKSLSIAFFSGACLFMFMTNLRMHPLQYVTFNALIGGPAGAYGRYELDYWLLAHRQVLEARDEWAPRRAGYTYRIYAGGLMDVFKYQLPEDMVYVRAREQPDFIIATTTMLAHQQILKEPVYVVERMGLPICVVYAMSNLEK